MLTKDVLDHYPKAEHACTHTEPWGWQDLPGHESSLRHIVGWVLERCEPALSIRHGH